MQAVRLKALILMLTAASAAGAVPARAQDAPILHAPRAAVELPRYQMEIRLDVAGHTASVREVVTWTNPCRRPATELVFNAHSHYHLPDKDIGFMAKMAEILRMPPDEMLDVGGPACLVNKVTLVGLHDPATSRLPPGPASTDTHVAAFHFRPDNDTALVVPLPESVAAGEQVTVVLDFIMRLPQKQGRWGQWRDVTFLSNWNPVLAVYDEQGWQPTPYIPWHQPFFNEAGSYDVRVTLPRDQHVACTGSIVSVTELPDGWQQVHIAVSCARDFALLCSARYCAHTGQAGAIHIHCLALPEHDHYAQAMVRYAAEALTVYSNWFGPYPYPDFTIAESYFGWNGNECAGLVMIDERVFNMPHVADGFVEALVSHETCHQWWYNVVGTNGFCETWMDEALATYFSHRLLTVKHGKNNNMITWPKDLEWLPNVPRETYRYYGLYGTLGRGEAGPSVQEMTKYGHIINLFSMCYDRGSKIVGMIEDRLGEVAFFDFMHHVYATYHFRILRVKDFQRELEAYTGRSWEEFFRHWLHSADVTDWCVEKVDVDELAPSPGGKVANESAASRPCRVTVLLHQKADYNEQTVLGFAFDGNGYQIRLPILPQVPEIELADPPAHITTLPGNRVRVEVCLPRRPIQICVDPDQVLVDRDPSNNCWKREVRCRFSPVYISFLEDSDLTTAYDRWNVTAGPWFFGTAYSDPWYTRSSMGGVRLGLYRTQEFSGGVYAAYRTDYRDIAVGADALWDHWPWPHTQVGFNAERSLTTLGGDEPASDRGVLFGRYVFEYSDSLYLPPMHYLEAFASVQENMLPTPENEPPGAVQLNNVTLTGLHYHHDYLTPYWDPQGGYRIDATYALGIPIFGEHETLNRFDAQVSFVKGLPDGLGWLSDTRVAARVYGAVSLPTRDLQFSFGGGELFRGLDLDQRQGSMVWVGSVEWRFPIARHLTWDCCDHIAGLRNINGAAFYDVGNSYVNGHETGPIAHALGGGIRLDVAWFSIVERSTIRLDVAKTVNSNAPTEFWLGFQMPF
jgi:hypothetical protein